MLATSLSELFVRTPPQHATTTQYCWLGATFSNDSLEASPSAKPCILLTFTSSLACASSLIMICLFLAYELGPNKRLDDNGTCEREKCCYLRFPRIFGLLNFGFWLASFVYVSKLWAEARNQDGIPLKVDETAKATIVMIGLNFLLWVLMIQFCCLSRLVMTIFCHRLSFC